MASNILSTVDDWLLECADKFVLWIWNLFGIRKLDVEILSIVVVLIFSVLRMTELRDYSWSRWVLIAAFLFCIWIRSLPISQMVSEMAGFERKRTSSLVFRIGLSLYLLADTVLGVTLLMFSEEYPKKVPITGIGVNVSLFLWIYLCDALTPKHPRRRKKRQNKIVIRKMAGANG